MLAHAPTIKDQKPPEICHKVQNISGNGVVNEYKRLVKNKGMAVDVWGSAPEKHRIVAINRETVCKHMQQLLNNMSLTQAIATTLASTSPGVATALVALDNPKKGSLRNWHKAWSAEGKNALLPCYKGTQRKEYGWEITFLRLYHQPQKPSLAKVARDLREVHGFTTASENNVRYFYSLLPANLQQESPWRVGRKIYTDLHREHVMRTSMNIGVGEIYQGDGHTIDVYLKHPKTGHIWRPELTVFMDIRSRYIVGWYLSIAESSITTMAALSNAFATWDHVCAMVHVDHGSGFKSKIMNDETTGFYASFGITPIFSLPGNAKGKGHVERFFRTMEDDFGKDFATYCGYDMSKDASRHFSNKKLHKMEAENQIKIPTVDEWCLGFRAWLQRYHNRPHPEQKNVTRAQLWSQLDNVPVHDAALLVKPRQTVTVARSTITLHKRIYRYDFMYQYNGEELVAEYDLHDDSHIRLFDKEGRWLFNAELKVRKDGVQKSRMDDALVKRTREQVKRIDNKREETIRQGQLPETHAPQVDEGLLELHTALAEMEEAKQPANESNEIDISLLQETIPQTDDQSGDFDFYQLMQQQEQ